MIATGNHQPRFRHSFNEDIECFDHQFQAFVCTPFAEGKNALNRIPSPPEVGKFRPPGQDPMCAQVDIVTSIFVIENFSVARHEHRNRVRQQKHAGGDRSRKTVKRLVANSHVL